MQFGDRLKMFRERKGLTQEQLGKLTGSAKSTISNYESGNREPDVAKIKAFARALGISGDELLGTGMENAPSISDEAMKVAMDYQGLDHWGRKVVRSVIADEQLRVEAESARTDPIQDPGKVIYLADWYPTMPMSAGTGQPAGYDEAEELRLIKKPPRGTSFVAPVSGDSMEPTYHDGDKLFIRICEEITPGQTGVFYMDGQLLVKELGEGVLISHNPDYPPRPMTEDVRCQGLVLGICDDSYLEA